MNVAWVTDIHSDFFCQMQKMYLVNNPYETTQYLPKKSEGKI
jgi:hypothetical protein